MSKGLGRGLDSLVPTNFDIQTVAEPGEHVRSVSLDSIMVNPDQPRKTFDETALQELAASIKQHGVIQHLVVTPVSGKDGMYRIVAGERRYRASRIAQLTSVPVIIRNHEELEELEIALVENVQRVDLSPLEQAVSITRLRDQFSLSLKDISKKLGKAETTISNTVRLLQLPKEAVEALQKNTISEGHARAILALKNDAQSQKTLLNNIITQKLSVRAAESYVKDKKNIPKKATTSTVSDHVTRRIGEVSKRTGMKLAIAPKKRGGNITIGYSDNTELESALALLEKLSNKTK